MTHNIMLHFYVLERSLKVEIKSKDELNSTIDEILSRLSMVEQSSKEKPKEDDEPKPKEDDKKDAKVESVDEIEKLLNS